MARNVKSDAGGFSVETEEGFTGGFKNAENKASPIPQSEEGGGNVGLPKEFSSMRTAAGEFNMSGNVIRQAAIGNEGPVTLNQTMKIFEPGATDARYHIAGGDFTQANIGGKAVYNNESSTVNGKAGIRSEEFVLIALEKGLTCEQFIMLLKKNYSLAQIAFSIPQQPTLRAQMVKAMLLD